jgi:nitrogen fixation/metabolism regulation signal transduction histidine kinase
MADARKACDIMTGSLTRAADLITSFKQVAVDQASGQRRRFRLDEVLHDTLATYAAQLRRAGCVVTVDVPADLVFDSYPGSLSQVFSNLIGNALLHGFDGRESGAMPSMRAARARSGDAGIEGQRRRHDRRGAAQDLRSLLHHQDGAGRFRAGNEYCL